MGLAHLPFLVQAYGQALGGDHAVGVGEQLAELIPVDVAVEPDAEPATMPDVRRPEERVRFGGGECLLGPGRCGAPEMRDALPPRQRGVPAAEAGQRALLGADLFDGVVRRGLERKPDRQRLT